VLDFGRGDQRFLPEQLELEIAQFLAPGAILLEAFEAEQLAQEVVLDLQTLDPGAQRFGGELVQSERHRDNESLADSLYYVNRILFMLLTFFRYSSSVRNNRG
jgi:hypothetical protein